MAVQVPHEAALGGGAPGRSLRVAVRRTVLRDARELTSPPPRAALGNVAFLRSVAAGDAAFYKRPPAGIRRVTDLVGDHHPELASFNKVWCGHMLPLRYVPRPPALRDGEPTLSQEALPLASSLQDNEAVLQVSSRGAPLGPPARGAGPRRAAGPRTATGLPLGPPSGPPSQLHPGRPAVDPPPPHRATAALLQGLPARTARTPSRPRHPCEGHSNRLNHCYCCLLWLSLLFAYCNVTSIALGARRAPASRAVCLVCTDLALRDKQSMLFVLGHNLLSPTQHGFTSGA